MAARAGQRVHEQPGKFSEGLIEQLVDWAKAFWTTPIEDPPPVLGYLWNWFNDLSHDREMGFGIGYIRSSEYEAWARLNCIQVGVTELKTLKALDRAFVASHSGQDDKPPDPEQSKSVMASLQKIAEDGGKKPKAKGKK